MSGLPPLAPIAALDEIFPPKTVLAPRTEADRMRWINFGKRQLDHLTGSAVSVLGGMPLICHRNTLTAEIRDFFALAGLQLDGEFLTYASASEAFHLARECKERGLRLAYFYPPPETAANDEDLVVPRALYDWLNDKTRIDELCVGRYLPRHRHLFPAELDQIADFMPGQAIYMKVCHPGASGGGADVKFCPSPGSRLRAIDWLNARPSGWTGIRLEAAVDVRESWCLNLAIDGPAGVRFLGAAAQLFSSPASQSGSRIDAVSQPSASTIEIAMEIAGRAANLGFVGIAGFDIGETEAGEPYVFDLNFRLAACSPQVLLHEPATRRIGGKISQSWSHAFKGPLAPALASLEELTRSGRFVPLRLYDSTLADDDDSRINGMLVASTVDEIEALSKILSDAMSRSTPRK